MPHQCKLVVLLLQISVKQKATVWHLMSQKLQEITEDFKVFHCWRLSVLYGLKQLESDQKCEIQERKRYFWILSLHLWNHIPAVLRLSHFWKPAPPSAPTTDVHTIEIQSFFKRKHHLNERKLEINPVYCKIQEPKTPTTLPKNSPEQSALV
ncbi:uncharacterized protein FYW23_003360 [Sylvia borin]